MDWLCHYCIICTNLSIRTTVRYIIGSLVILIVYFKSRLGEKHSLSILFALISGFVLSVSYVFQNVFKQHHRDRFNILLGKTVDLKGIIIINLKLLSDLEDGSEGVFSRERKLKDLYRNNILITSLPPLVKNGAL
jgi:hypothetical protein